MKAELREEKEKRVELLLLFWLEECLLDFEWFLVELMQKMKCQKIEWKESQSLGVLLFCRHLFGEFVTKEFWLLECWSLEHLLLVSELLMFGM